LSDYNGPDPITAPIPQRDILGMGALIIDGFKIYTTENEMDWATKNLLDIASNRNDKSWLYKALSFSQMTRNPCVYEHFKDLCKDLKHCTDTCNVGECYNYTIKVRRGILDKFLSPEEVQDPELPYTIGLCQK